MKILFVHAATDNQTIENFSRELESELVVFDPQSDATAPEVSDFGAMIISGSAASVLEEEPWIETVEELVRDAHEEIPVLGVCWGHQIIAQALGGRVEERDYREIGYTSVHVVQEDQIVEGFDEPQLVFETHEDQVVEIPEDGQLLVENNEGIQGFRAGSSTYGVQFHPEYEEKDMRDVINKYIDGLWRQEELSKLTEPMYEKFSGSKKILSNFEKIAQEHER